MNYFSRSVALLLMSATLLCACGHGSDENKDVPPVVDGDRITFAEADKDASFLKIEAVSECQASPLRLPGRLVWNENQTVRIYPQLAGRVLRIQTDIGSSVKAGQALATLSSPDFGQAHAELKKAQADARFSDKAFQRGRELLEAGVIAQKDAEQAEADYARANAEVERAQSRVKLLGQVSSSIDQSYTLTSPIAGIVVERNLNVGQEFRFDQVTQAPFVVTDPTSLWIQMDASETDLAGVRQGEEFWLEVNQFPGEKFAGKIMRIADFVDPVARTIKIRGLVPNADRRLKGEMFATASIVLPPSARILVSSKAVFLVGSERFVFVEESVGKYVRRKVEVGTDRNGQIEVLSGLVLGEKVVVEGNLHLLKFFKPNSTVALK